MFFILLILVSGVMVMADPPTVVFYEFRPYD